MIDTKALKFWAPRYRTDGGIEGPTLFTTERQARDYTGKEPIPVTVIPGHGEVRERWACKGQFFDTNEDAVGWRAKYSLEPDAFIGPVYVVDREVTP